ncbi:FAD-binding oxidoreductase [Roseomonas sp. HJA6]|uniref:FAD-binding oxidoreductase n=1 Tax=Roseomonas alba TaxID=2846776 RepID=A0ABS7A6N9_9PROT|nr:FAD-binding oxidoreductase [Neoroseomonas alba]MBW6397968.1 FAD-binding oxidoreductase [Neoroseomonas alba]
MRRIVIIGGGIMGSAIAYSLARAGVVADVTVVEPDPTYEFAATPRAVGGVRLQHAVPENVEMSLYGDTVYSAFDQHVVGGKVTFDPQFHRIGYLFLVEGAEAIASLEANVRMQKELGVEVDIHDVAELRRRYPSFTFKGAEAGALSPGDGQIDPNAALMGYRRAAEGLGITYLKDRVVALDMAGNKVALARLESGATLPVEIVINTANCWAADICAMVGVTVPIAPMRRQQFHFLSQDPVETFPAIRYLNGFSFRQHSGVYLCGHTNFGEPPGFNWELQHDVFEEQLWPQLAEQCAAFETIKPRGGWVGHYDMNHLDGNPVIDWIDSVPNMLLCAGFSGHGLQHAPAVGRAVKELILDGGFRSIDLSRFSYRRIVDGTPIPDDGPKA